MSFLVQPGLFPTPTSAKNKMHVVASLKSLEDHLLYSNSLAQTINNISKVFQWVSIEKEAIEEGRQKSLQEVANLKS